MLRTNGYRKIGSFQIVFILMVGFFMMPMLSTLPASGASVWYDSNWQYRRQIVIDHTKVSGTQTGFVLLVDLTDGGLVGKAQADGDDFVFTDADSAKINHEIELYDGNVGGLLAWVCVPSVSSTQDTIIYLYYGNPAADNQEAPEVVWDSGYQMVLHLSEAIGVQFDSTAYGNDASPAGGVSQGISGMVDGADSFDGSNDYLSVVHSSGLTGYATSFSASFWLKLDDTTRRQTILNKYDTAGNQRAWYVEFLTHAAYGKVLDFFASQDGVAARDWYAPFSPTAGVWYNVVVVWQANSVPKFYINGVQVSTIGTGTIASIYNNAGAPLFVGRSYTTGRYLDGGLDEVCISSSARSAQWIRTTYNSQVSPSAFYSVGPEEVWGSCKPSISNATPAEEAVNVYTNPALSVSIADPESDLLILRFETDATGTWEVIKVFTLVPGGTYSCVPETMNQLGTLYNWRVSVSDDGVNWVTQQYSFTTTSTVLSAKWTATKTPYASTGVLIANVVGDSKEEVIMVGAGKAMVLDGSTGGVIWSRDLGVGVRYTATPEIADLNKDGVLELVLQIDWPPGLIVLHANDGSEYWRISDLGGGDHSGSLVIADIDGYGYPTIFCVTSTEHPSDPAQSTSRMYSITHDGTILHEAFVYHPCAGGLSIGDADNDGEFEVYYGDRYSSFSGDAGIPRGLQSFWASNLTKRWERPDVSCSSNRPMLADVTGDGILDVIAGHHNGGVAVVNSRDGTWIYNGLNLGQYTAPVHYQPSVYDIDEDGNLEMLMQDGEHNSYMPVVFDLVTHQVDARLPIVPGKYGPQIADVTGDGHMDIIVCNDTDIFVFDRTYTLVTQIKGLYPRLMYAVTQDIDGDGYNEVVVNRDGESGRIYAFDTPARTSTPRTRTEVRFNSERRNGVAEYVPLPGPEAPLIKEPLPAEGEIEVPVALSELSFRLASFQKDLMSYTVTTTPNIGSGSGTSVGNGRYSIPVSGVEYGKTYSWTISVSTGSHVTTETYAFKTKFMPLWWDANWQYRKAITIDPSKVSMDQTDFQVLIDVVDADLVGKAQSDGDDIVFVSLDNAKLSQEIESYDSSTGHLVAWVRIPYVSSTTYTTFYMYYGNSLSENQQDLGAVWSSTSVMVLHLDEETEIQYDSTSNGNNATPFNGVIQGVVGLIDGSDTFDGANDYLQVAHSDTLSGFTEALTASFWIRFQDVSRRQTILNKYNNGAGQRAWYVEYQTGRLGFFASQDGTTYKEWHASFTPTAGAWYFVTVVWQANSILKFYVNGIQLVTTGDTAALAAINNNIGQPLYVGRCPFDSTRYLNGGLDEIRVSNTARSSSYVLTSYTNQKDPGIFYQIGAEQSLPSAPVISGPNPENGASNLPVSLLGLSFNLVDYQNDLMDYSVTTIPNIGGASVTGVPSGTYSVPVVGLQYGTTYTWMVTATDGIHHTTNTYTFATTLLADSEFTANPDSAALRTNGAGQDWYESWNTVPSTLLYLHTSNVGGNTGKKAGFTSSTSGYAYLSQEFSTPQIGTFSVQWDIYVDSIYNLVSGTDATGYMMIGDNSNGVYGPNSASVERFVYMGFYKNGGGTSGTMQLFSRQRNTDTQTFIATLNLDQWYTIRVDVNVAGGTYDVYVDGAFMGTYTSRTVKNSVTHISFAQWSNGAGAFYVDNVFSPALP